MTAVIKTNKCGFWQEECRLLSVCRGRSQRGQSLPFLQAEVEGQVGLAHLLSVYGVELVVHRHCEDVLPKAHATCRGDQRVLCSKQGTRK